MGQYKIPALCLAMILLVACDSTDVEGTCFSEAAHERLSDGKIKGMCMCQDKYIASQKLNEKELIWVTTLIKGRVPDKIEPKDRLRYKKVAEIQKASFAICGSAQ